MAVTVRNLLSSATEQARAALGGIVQQLEAARPYQATFRFLKGDGSSFSLVLPYNPPGWSTDQAAQWAPRGALGVADDASDWRGNAPQEVNFEWLATSEDAERLELSALRPLELYVHALDRLTGEPYLVVLQLGAHEYRGHLTRVSVERRQTTRDGWARVAQVNVSMMCNPKSPGAR
jgi:hypothetical protein